MCFQTIPNPLQHDPINEMSLQKAQFPIVLETSLHNISQSIRSPHTYSILLPRISLSSQSQISVNTSFEYFLSINFVYTFRTNPVARSMSSAMNRITILTHFWKCSPPAYPSLHYFETDGSYLMKFRFNMLNMTSFPYRVLSGCRLQKTLLYNYAFWSAK